ncbi:unnamed protein product [Closterium sp. NIES-53]
MDDARQYALYADVDYCADGSVCSHVRSLGCLPPVSVDMCLSSLGACVSALGACVAFGTDTPPAEVSLSFTLDSGASQSVARSSTTLPCPVVPSGVLRGLHTPFFTRNLVGVGYLQDRGITVTFVGGGRTAVCTDAATCAVLATFNREPLSGLYVLRTERSSVVSSAQVAASRQVQVSSPVAVSGQVVVSGQVAASCSCRSLAYLTVLWHHRLGYLSLPRLCSMANHSLVSGLPRVFLLLPPSLAPPYTPCIVGRLHVTPHSSLRPATAPFQNFHLDVWGPAPTLGPERERYFLVVVNGYSRYTMVFPFAKKSEVTSTFIRWLLATEGTRGSCVCCLHSDCGQKGVAERRIGLVMDIARTSMIHARVPRFLWPYALRYAAHQLNLQPRVSQPEVSPTSLWTGSTGVGSAFRVWGCLALVRDTSADKLLARTIPCVFLGFPVGSPDYSFYHPPLHQFLDSRDVRFDESVSYFTRYPCPGLSVPPPPLFLAPSLPPAPTPPVPPPPPGRAPSGVSHATPLPSVVHQVASPSPQSSSQSPQQPSALPRQVTVDSVGVGAGGAATCGARSRGARAGGAGAGGASSGGAGAGGTGTLGAGTEETGAGGTTREAGAAAIGPEAAAAAAAAATTAAAARATAAADAAAATFASPTVYGPTFAPPDSTLAVFSPPQSRSSPPVVPHDWTNRCPPRAMPWSPLADLRSVLFRSPPRRSLPVSVLPSPPKSSLSVSSHPITDYYRAARSVVSRVLASLITDPRASPSPVSALTAASTRRLDYATQDRKFELEFLAAASPSLYVMLLSLDGDLDSLDIPTPRTYREALSRNWASQWKVAMDSELTSWRSTGTYVDAVPPPRANVVDGMWLFKVKQPPGSPHVFKVHYVARGFSQHEGVDFFKTFAPTPKMTTLWVLLHLEAQREYELHSLDFSTAFLEGRLHKEIWLRRPPGFTDSFPPGTQWSLRRPVYSLS